MTNEESDLIISEQNKSTEEILKAVAKVKADSHELCNLKDMRIANLEKENAELDMKRKAERQIFQGIVEKKNGQLTKAKEIIRWFVVYEKGEGIITNYNNFLEQAEQFLKECK